MHECSSIHRLGFRVHHVMLPVADLDRSIDFYTRFMGMTLKERRERRKGRTALVGFGTPAAPPYLELIENRDTATAQALPLNTHVAIDVSDLRQYCEILQREGHSLTRPLIERPDGSGLRAWINDPDGNPLELAERPAP